ncbi:MAG: amino acid permease [Anaerolineaceae bacterium]
MAKRTLKRQLNLLQVTMLGTAGTLGSGIFVLTGVAAGIAGSATILAIIIAGILSFSIALNYCELATTYPETGGAMTYVREAWGKGLLSFLVGSMDCISSTFYTALSAVGFAYSLSVFFPAINITLFAIGAIVVFSLLNILGVTSVGNAQIVMGGILVLAFLVYIISGFVMPNGFTPAILMPNGSLFQSKDTFENIFVVMRTIALIYAVYVGFEIIADDAEEVKNPTKNIPLAIMISLGVIIIIYTLVVVVALGTPNVDIAANETTALSATIAQFLPVPGVVMIGIAGMVGALTSINSSMLSATRESFTLSRDGAWPLFLSRLNKARVPFYAILMIGAISILITTFNAVEFLSYITSAGYLFVLFLSNLAMIRLRSKYPYIHRPFKVPFFPLTPIVASVTCLIVISFSQWDALVFTGVVILIFAIYYFAKLGLESWRAEHKRSLSPGRYRVVVPYQPSTRLDSVVKIASMLAEAKSDMNMCFLRVIAAEPTEATRQLERLQSSHQYILERFVHYAVERNVPMYSKTVVGKTLADGIIDEIKTDNNVRLVLFRWPDDETHIAEFRETVTQIIKTGIVNVGVLYDKGLDRIGNILVPVGGGYHSKLAIQIANDLTLQEKENVDYLRIVGEDVDEEVYEDQLAFLQEVVMTELGNIPGNAGLKIVRSSEPAEAISHEASERDYDLIIIGSFEGANEGQPLFGDIVDKVRNEADCSTLVIRQHESQASSWLRRQLKSN